MLWWLSARDNSNVSAQELLYTACEQTEAQQDYDFVTVLNSSGEDEPTRERLYIVSMSGDDFTATSLRSDGVLQIIGKDGVTYYREGDGEWKIDERNLFGLGHIQFILSSRSTTAMGGTALCPEGAVARVGDEEVDDTATTHFQITETNVGPLGSVLAVLLDGYEGVEIPREP